MNNLPFAIDRTLVIHAPRDVVFRYFTDSERFARWWGKGSTIDGRVGGALRIQYPGTVVARGTIEAFEPDRRIVFTYGYENAHPELPPGGSRVTVELHDDPAGTRLSFRHEVATAELREMHRAGWRYHLAVFANVVADEQHAGAAEACDQWFAAWAEADAGKRRALLERCTTDDVALHDRYSCLRGRADLDGHIHNTHVHLPGIVMARAGAIRQCQGTLLVDWEAKDAQGNPRGKGCNVVTLAPDGRIAAVVGFW